MRKFLLFALLFALGSKVALFAADAPATSSSAKDSTVYEMRVYYAAEGKLDDLNARFRDHTCRLFEKHGIKNVGYFVPIDNKDNILIYFISFPSREAREKSWKAFFADPDWQKAAKESEANGRLVTRVDNYFLQTTDYSPALKIEKKGDRVFELRTYTTPPGKLDDLHARFRDHTMELFKRHGMENVVYFNKMSDQKGADTTLIYILGHKSKDAAKKAFQEFGADPEWQQAKKESEKNGALTIQGGVKSEFLVPTDYSPLK
jgi:hypothetical protein